MANPGVSTFLGYKTACVKDEKEGVKEKRVENGCPLTFKKVMES